MKNGDLMAIRENLAKVAVVDGGGRGAALVDAYLGSHGVGKILAFPGNDMMKLIPRMRGYDGKKQVFTFPEIKTTDTDKIVSICRDQHVALVDVAQDNAVAAGLVDALHASRIDVIGPTAAAGMIESNKAETRMALDDFGLTEFQPSYKIFKSENEGIEYIEGIARRPLSVRFAPVFVKASGLCEGKGAIPARTPEEAIAAVKQMKAFKDGAGSTFIIEDWIRNPDGSNGEEFSAFIVSDGTRFKHLGYAQDHKAVGNFDLGPNTGGMGCSTPPLMVTQSLHEKTSYILEKTISGLNEEGRRYKGVLYLGGMAVRENGALAPKILEFNSRHGDPECQVILPGLLNGLFGIGMAVSNGDISRIDIVTDGKARVAVAGASRGYPGNYDSVKGKQIFGLEKAMEMPGVTIYGAGVKIQDGKFYASGGRLFYAVGEGADVTEARSKAYAAMSHVFIEGNNLHYRTDIGYRDVERLLRK